MYNLFFQIRNPVRSVKKLNEIKSKVFSPKKEVENTNRIFLSQLEMLRQLNRKLDKQIVRNFGERRASRLPRRLDCQQDAKKNKYNGRVYENEDSVEEYTLDYEDEEEVGDAKGSDYDYSRSEYDEDNGGGQIQFKSKTMIFENERLFEQTLKSRIVAAIRFLEQQKHIFCFGVAELIVARVS